MKHPLEKSYYKYWKRTNFNKNENLPPKHHGLKIRIPVPVFMSLIVLLDIICYFQRAVI